MADVFVSYSRKDKILVEPLVRALEAHQLSVWWDRSITHNEDFGAVIRREIKCASAVVVCWSSNAEQSEWVCSEADEAKAQHKYLGVLIAPGRPPVPFNTMDAADLVDWSTAADDDQLLKLLEVVGSAIGRDDIAGLASAKRAHEQNLEAQRRAQKEVDRVRRYHAEQEQKASERALLEAQAAARRAEEQARRGEREKAERRTLAHRQFMDRCSIALLLGVFALSTVQIVWNLFVDVRTEGFGVLVFIVSLLLGALVWFIGWAFFVIAGAILYALVVGAQNLLLRNFDNEKFNGVRGMGGVSRYALLVILVSILSANG